MTLHHTFGEDSLESRDNASGCYSASSSQYYRRTPRSWPEKSFTF